MQRIFFIIICSLFSLLSFSQTVEETLKTADSLYLSGSYKEAIGLFCRLNYFDSSNAGSYTEKMGSCNYLMENIPEAIHWWDKALNCRIEDSLKNQIYMSLAESQARLKNYENSISCLNNIISNDSGVLSDINFLMGLNYFGLSNYDSAGYYWNRLMVNNLDKDEQQVWECTFKNLKSKKLKNPKTASVLSALLPGAGQWYAKDFRNSLNSMVLVDGLAVLTVITANNFTVLVAMLSVLPWFYRYYTGGIARANEAARRYNSRYKQKQYHALWNIMNNNFSKAPVSLY